MISGPGNRDDPKMIVIVVKWPTTLTQESALQCRAGREMIVLWCPSGLERGVTNREAGVTVHAHVGGVGTQPRSASTTRRC